MQTGDPLIDSLMSFLTNGGKLQSAGAILALGTAIKSVAIPLADRIAQRFSLNFSGPNKLHFVVGVGVVTVGAISFFTQQGMSLGDVVLMGTEVGVAAVGIHESVSTIKSASKASKAAQETAQ